VTIVSGGGSRTAHPCGAPIPDIADDRRLVYTLVSSLAIVMPQHSVTVRELRGHLSDQLRRVRRGETIEITSRGEPVARLVPIGREEAVKRSFGFMKGRITIAPDFDEVPSDLLASIDADIFPGRRPKAAR
jgi:prevent-host-death family protein